MKLVFIKREIVSSFFALRNHLDPFGNQYCVLQPKLKYRSVIDSDGQELEIYWFNRMWKILNLKKIVKRFKTFKNKFSAFYTKNKYLNVQYYFTPSFHYFIEEYMPTSSYSINLFYRLIEGKKFDHDCNLCNVCLSFMDFAKLFS